MDSKILEEFLLDNMKDIMLLCEVCSEPEDEEEEEEEEEEEQPIYLPSYDQIKNTDFKKKGYYKRRRYFNKLLNDLMCINITKIDDLLLLELLDLGIKDISDIRKHLKILGKSDHYDVGIKILTIVGLSKKKFTESIIARLRKDFLSVADHFQRDSSLFFGRHSFINYRYFIIQCLLYYDEYDLASQVVPLNNNIDFHNKCWQNILDNNLLS